MLQEKSFGFRDFFSLDNLFSDQSRHLIPLTFREIFSLFQQFETLTSCNILIFGFSRHLVLATFCLKVRKQISQLSPHFLLTTFSLYKRFVYD